MKKVLCACLAMLVLLCGAALAENFRCELPEGAYVSDTTPLPEGDNLLLATYGGLYRVPLETRRSWRMCQTVCRIRCCGAMRRGS